MDPSAQSAVRSVAAIGLKRALRGRLEKGVDGKAITHAAARRCFLLGRDCRDRRAWVVIIAVVVRANAHLATVMIAEKTADEIRREAKAG